MIQLESKAQFSIWTFERTLCCTSIIPLLQSYM